MNESMNTLITRRSCRAYTDQLVPDDVLARILEAGTYAATGMGHGRRF